MKGFVLIFASASNACNANNNGNANYNTASNANYVAGISLPKASILRMFIGVHKENKTCLVANFNWEVAR